MKNIILFRIFAIFIASAVFFSCSKDEFIPGKSNVTTSPAKMNPPEFMYGGITGNLIPTPSFAIVKVYNDELNSVVYGCYAEPGGIFKLAGVIPGTYHMTIAYVPGNQGTIPEPMPYQYFRMEGIVVNINTVTNLGDIMLIKR